MTTQPAKLLLKKCKNCGKILQPPVFNCPDCGCAELHDHEIDAEGEIYTYTIVRATFGKWGKKTPYTLAIVEIQGQLRIIGVVENAEAQSRPIAVGDKVRFSHYDEAQAPIFALAPVFAEPLP